MFENLKEDLRRLIPGEKCSLRGLIAGLVSPGFQAIFTYRLFHWCWKHGVPTQPFRFLAERFVEMTTGISIPACCKIGKGFRIHHFGCIIFHPSVEIGDYCTVYHEVTIGDKGGSGGAAKIGNHVLIGAGAKIVGEVTIGDNCIIGANAVVAKSMPPDTVAVGNPAQIRPRSDR